MWFFFPLNYTRVVFIHFKEKKVLNNAYFFGFSFVIYIARRTQHGPLVIEQLLGVGEKVDSEMDCLGELPPLIQLINDNDATLHWTLEIDLGIHLHWLTDTSRHARRTVRRGYCC